MFLTALNIIQEFTNLADTSVEHVYTAVKKLRLAQVNPLYEHPLATAGIILEYQENHFLRCVIKAFDHDKILMVGYGFSFKGELAKEAFTLFTAKLFVVLYFNRFVLPFDKLLDKVFSSRFNFLCDYVCIFVTSLQIRKEMVFWRNFMWLKSALLVQLRFFASFFLNVIHAVSSFHFG